MITRIVSKRELEQMNRVRSVILVDPETELTQRFLVGRLLDIYKSLSTMLAEDPEQLQMLFTDISDRVDDLRRRGITAQTALAAFETGTASIDDEIVSRDHIWLTIHEAIHSDGLLTIVAT